jgi:hypothetical protein
MVLQDGSGQLQIEQSADWADTVVWNPGEHKCADMADMPEHGFARMLCVEAAQVFEPVRIPAGGRLRVDLPGGGGFGAIHGVVAVLASGAVEGQAQVGGGEAAAGRSETGRAKEHWNYGWSR